MPRSGWGRRFEPVPPAKASGSYQRPFLVAFPMGSCFSLRAEGLEDGSAPGPLLLVPGAVGDAY